MIRPILPVSLSISCLKKCESLKSKEKTSFAGSSAPKKVPRDNVYGVKIHKHIPETPLDQLIYHETRGRGPHYDEWTMQNLYSAASRPDKKWVFQDPSVALNRSLEDAINSNLTLVYGENIPKFMPKKIETPNYGDNWGRHANYIEINNRAIGNMNGDRTNYSILNTIKLLPLIPPSHDRWANCLLISQLFPNIWGDGWNNNGENSIYGIKLEHERLSDNIGYLRVGGKDFTPEEQVKAFNDIAHLRGFKTSFRMLISEDQIKLGDSENFRWNNPAHVKAFIIACCKGIELGFDGIFFDSVKHVGNYAMEHYAGVGAVPSYEQMQYILYEIRQRTGRGDLSFSGEKAEGDLYRFKEMGLNAGASQMNADSLDDVRNLSNQQKDSPVFAYGPVVSDDNDVGFTPRETKLKRISSALYGYYNPNDKLPSFMQMHDLFPLRGDVSTHDLMMENRNFSTDGTAVSHLQNLFAHDNEAQEYRKRVANEFAHCYIYP